MKNSRKDPGLFQLSVTIQQNAANKWLENKFGYQRTKHCDNSGNPIVYYINLAKSIIVFATPIQSGNIKSSLDSLKLEAIDKYHLIVPLIGNGITEKHIVTCYKAPGESTKPLLFDSKISDPEHFFNSGITSLGANFIRPVLGALNAFFNIPYKKEIILTANSKKYVGYEKINYISLGTQSYFDSITCGYHTLANTLNILSIIEAGNEVNKNSLLKESQKNPFSNVAISSLEASDNPIEKTYFAFIQQAWRNTFLAGLELEQSTAIHFQHYFLGWPNEKGILRKALYITLLGFLIYPIKNTLKLLIELPIQVIASSFDYMKNKLLLWAPTSPPLQYLRSSLLLINYLFYGLCKALSLVIHASAAIIPNTFTQKSNTANEASKKLSNTDDSFEDIMATAETEITCSSNTTQQSSTSWKKTSNNSPVSSSTLFQPPKMALTVNEIPNDTNDAENIFKSHSISLTST